MARFEKLSYGEDDQKAADRQTASLAGLAAALFLVVVSLFLVHALQRSTNIEDCLLAGRTNCDAMVAAAAPVQP